MSDLIQEGNLALSRIVETFTPDRGSFPIVAARAIEGAIEGAIEKGRRSWRQA